MGKFKVFVVVMSLLGFAGICISIQNSQIKNNGTVEQKSLPAYDVPAELPIVTIDSVESVETNSANAESSQIISSKAYFNYDAGKKSLDFQTNEYQNRGSLILTENNCTYEYDFEISSNIIKCKFITSSCKKRANDLILEYNSELDEIYMKSNGRKITYSQDQINTDINNIESLSGLYVADKIWKQQADGWYNIHLITEILIDVNTNGILKIESYDFLSSFDNKARLANMNGYNSAYIDNPIFIKSYLKDGVKHATFRGFLKFNSREQMYGYEINYSVMIKDNQIYGLALNRNHRTDAWWMRISPKENNEHQE